MKASGSGEPTQGWGGGWGKRLTTDQEVGKTGARPVDKREWGQDSHQATISLSLREMDHLADISLFLIFVMKTFTCNISKENKTSKTATAIEVIALLPKTSPDIVDPEQGSHGHGPWDSLRRAADATICRVGAAPPLRARMASWLPGREAGVSS